METVEADKFYIASCYYCGDLITLKDSDFILLNNERICYYKCKYYDEKMKVLKGE